MEPGTTRLSLPSRCGERLLSNRKGVTQRLSTLSFRRPGLGGEDVVSRQFRKVLGHSAGKVFEHIVDGDSKVTDARLTASAAAIHRDSFEGSLVRMWADAQDGDDFAPRPIPEPNPPGLRRLILDIRFPDLFAAWAGF